MPDASLDENTLDKLLESEKKTIIIGDLNLRHRTWNCYSSNSNANKLCKYLNSNVKYIFLAPNEPTHFPTNPNHKPSIIDMAIINNVNNVNIETRNELDSDHIPLNHNNKW